MISPRRQIVRRRQGGRRQRCGPEISAPSQLWRTRTSLTDLFGVTALSNALLTLHRVACLTWIMFLLAATAAIDE